MEGRLLTVFEDAEMLTILTALFYENPKSSEEISSEIEISKGIVKTKLEHLKDMGFVIGEEEKFRISDFGKVYVKSLGITKEEIKKYL